MGNLLNHAQKTHLSCGKLNNMKSAISPDWLYDFKKCLAITEHRLIYVQVESCGMKNSLF